MNKVLMIAYIFPPSGGAGVQRTSKFVKYLPDFGWQPVVLTVKNPSSAMMDFTLLEEIPSDVLIYKAVEWMPNTVANKLRKTLRSSSKQKSDRAKISNNEKPTKMGQVRSLLRLAYKKAIDMAIPDQNLPWVMPAYFVARKIIKKENPKAIYVSGPPFSAYLSAYLLGIKNEIPVILDFRDAWAQNPRLMENWRLKRVLVSFMEKRIIAIAKKVIFATQIMERSYEKKYPWLSLAFTTLTNGFDESDFVNVIPKKLTPISIVYMGRVTKERKLENFLVAIKNLLVKKGGLPEFKVYFVGEMFIGHQTRINDFGLQHVCELHDYMPHHEALSYALGADILLLLGSGDLAEMTGKIFEYLRVKRPIFAVVPKEGEAGLLIRQSGHGVVAQYDHIPEITSKLERMLLDVKSQRQLIPKTDTFIRQFDRQEQARELAAIMLDAIK